MSYHYHISWFMVTHSTFCGSLDLLLFQSSLVKHVFPQIVKQSLWKFWKPCLLFIFFVIQGSYTFFRCIKYIPWNTCVLWMKLCITFITSDWILSTGERHLEIIWILRIKFLQEPCICMNISSSLYLYRYSIVTVSSHQHWSALYHHDICVDIVLTHHHYCSVSNILFESFDFLRRNFSIVHVSVKIKYWKKMV